MRPDEDVELLAFHLHVVLLLVQLILQTHVDVHQFVTVGFIGLSLKTRHLSFNLVFVGINELKKSCSFCLASKQSAPFTVKFTGKSDNKLIFYYSNRN